jgi:hypothetical protein
MELSWRLFRPNASDQTRLVDLGISAIHKMASPGAHPHPGLNDQNPKLVNMVFVF